MQGKEMYGANTAALYATLGIEGTSYQVPYAATVEEIGSLSGKRVLDFGCGAGRSTQFLSFFDPAALVGVDHNTAMLEQARGRHLPQALFVEAGSAAAAQEIRAESFDAVFAFSVYCEFARRTEMEQATRAVYSYLKPGGSYFVATTNPYCGGAQFINFDYDADPSLKDGDPWPCHMHTAPPFVINDTFWTIETFDDVFCSCGFAITKCFFPLAQGDGWRDETKTAPQVVYCLTKPVG